MDTSNLQPTATAKQHISIDADEAIVFRDIQQQIDAKLNQLDPEQPFTVHLHKNGESVALPLPTMVANKPIKWTEAGQFSNYKQSDYHLTSLPDGTVRADRFNIIEIIPQNRIDDYIAMKKANRKVRFGLMMWLEREAVSGDLWTVLHSAEPPKEEEFETRQYVPSNKPDRKENVP